ncbi:sensor histidine kinase N-terminal domain-containing protein [Paraneptunicella aestuarii]|uniref:ATP-binding protein n=1 Tax=Paraneptunicella aestuarii TaxID=2831148 RepID=UPI001E315969|nr:ATP-binding protein [Paraneptunicella aestuarii]UAA40622.1 sensor histidine kinase N-terminal domain-containing protein [Paraneptunicella aestuarii]
MNSITRFLVSIIISVLTLVTFSAAIRGYNVSMSKASYLFDKDLQLMADTIRSLPTSKDNPQLIKLHQQDHLAFQIWHHDQLVLRTDNTPNTAIGPLEKGFYEQNFSGKRWRVYATYETKNERFILVAQSIDERFSVAEQLIVAAMSPLIISIPFLALLIFFLIGAGLKPLRKLSDRLDTKKSDDFSEVRLTNIPVELNPVVSKLNSLLSRLGASYQRERRFASDAAHELRTPLSVLTISLHNLANELQEQNLDTAQAKALNKGVERMGHVIEQMLMLNRTNPDTFMQQFSTFSLDALVREQIGDFYPKLEEKEQTIEFYGQNVRLTGDETSVGILIFNLLSNANKYIPVHGKIVLSSEYREQQPTLIIEDSGPGIPEQEYEHVFQRFYRIGGDRHNSNESGCGLGLAIVKQICDLHQARIELSRSESLGGLRITIFFNENADSKPNYENGGSIVKA